MRFKLIAKAGAGQDQLFDRPATDIIIGRDPSCDYVIDSSAISRRHAQIVPSPAAFMLEDLGSANGTFLNGARVTQATQLKSGDEIGLGKWIKVLFSVIPDLTDSIKAKTEPTESPSADDATISPPQLAIAIAGSRPATYELTQSTVTVGRDESNDIVIGSPIVSRRHASLERADGGYLLVVHPQAGNPIYIEGAAVSRPRQLQHQDKLRIGGQDPGSMVTMTYVSPSEAAVSRADEIALGDSTALRIGRDPTNDVVLDAPQVSRHHARLERADHRLRVVDLQSTNGTFVNDERVTEAAWVEISDSVRIGPYRFVVGEQALVKYDDSESVRVEAIGLNKWVRKDLNILQDISLVIQPREFVVVVGQSGGGKSTLVDAIAGYRPATHGRVTVNETDVYESFDAIRDLIGFVPQKDIIHMELTASEGLEYTARLRMPPDTSKHERHKRVMEVLEDLDLAHRKDVQISRLSGGQQKRVSIGVELLTKPGLFFLDEPTSGLDPGTETALMQLMRRMADAGRTILLITHATKNVLLADKVVFLARGGYLAWFGPPEEALTYFDRYRSASDRTSSEMQFDNIYALLDDPGMGSPEQWGERYRKDDAYGKYIGQPLGRAAGRPTPSTSREASRARKPRRRISTVRQFLTLSARNVKILFRDRFGLGLMLAAAPLIGLLDVLLATLMGRNLFDFNQGRFTDIVTTLFLLTVNGVLVGGLAQMREFVKEREVYRRERLVNLKILPYVLSKVWVAALLALYQAAAYTIIRYLAFDMPGGPVELLLVYLTLVLATMAGMMLGLFASALAPNANSAPLIVILLIIPQIVLGGALVPLPGYISAPISTRWGFQAFMGITGTGSDVAADACWKLPEELRAAMTLEDKEAAGCNCLGTNALREASCNFPGLGEFYSPEIEQPPPQDLPPPPERPADPVFPDPPQEPGDPTDQVAVAEYLAELEDYQAVVEGIQSQSEEAFAGYEAQIELFQARVLAYQQELVEWRIGRESAVRPAEGVIERSLEDYAWTFVNREDPTQYWPFLLTAWVGQGKIIGVLLVAILIVQKRRDVG